MTEIVSKIKTKNELNCKARDIVTIEEGDMDYNAALDKFANILTGDPGSNAIRGWLNYFHHVCYNYSEMESTGGPQHFLANHKTSSEQKNWIL